MDYSTAILIGEKELQGKTNEDLSEIAGWEARVISKVLKGDKRAQLLQIEKVAEALGFETKVEFQKREPELAS